MTLQAVFDPADERLSVGHPEFDPVEHLLQLLFGTLLRLKHCRLPVLGAYLPHLLLQMFENLPFLLFETE